MSALEITTAVDIVDNHQSKTETGCWFFRSFVPRVLCVVWLTAFVFVMLGGGIIAVVPNSGPQNMLCVNTALFLPTLVLPSFTHSGSVVASGFMLLYLPLINEDSDHKFGGEAWVWEAASVWMSIFFQTRLLLITTLERAAEPFHLSSTSTKRSTMTRWENATSVLTVIVVALTWLALVLFCRHESNDKTATVPPTLLTLSILATVACLCLVALLISIAAVSMFIIQALHQQHGGGAGNLEDSRGNDISTTHLLYTTLTLPLL